MATCCASSTGPTRSVGPPEFDFAAFAQSIVNEGGPRRRGADDLVLGCGRCLDEEILTASIVGISGYFADRGSAPGPARAAATATASATPAQGVAGVGGTSAGPARAELAARRRRLSTRWLQSAAMSNSVSRRRDLRHPDPHRLRRERHDPVRGLRRTDRRHAVPRNAARHRRAGGTADMGRGRGAQSRSAPVPRTAGAFPRVGATPRPSFLPTVGRARDHAPSAHSRRQATLGPVRRSPSRGTRVRPGLGRRAPTVPA